MLDYLRSLVCSTIGERRSLPGYGIVEKGSGVINVSQLAVPRMISFSSKSPPTYILQTCYIIVREMGRSSKMNKANRQGTFYDKEIAEKMKGFVESVKV